MMVLDYMGEFQILITHDLLYSAAFLLGTAASFSLDKELKNLSARNQNSATKSMTDIGEKYGNGIVFCNFIRGIIYNRIVNRQ